MCLALPGRILSIETVAGKNERAKVDFSGVERDIVLLFLPEAKVGDYVLVHLDIAISIVDEIDAQKTLDLAETQYEV